MKHKRMHLLTFCLLVGSLLSISAASIQTEPAAPAGILLFESTEKAIEVKKEKTLFETINEGGIIVWVIVGLGIATLLLKNEINSLSSQTTDLEVGKRRKSLVVEQLRNKINELQVSEAATHSGGDDISPMLLATLAELKTQVIQGLPFKTSKRLAVVETLKKQLLSNTTDPRKVANKLWALIEDEIRLSKENGLYQQTIVLNGENRLADVAKIGMMYLYFKTRDDQVGMARQLNGQWQYQTVSEPIAQQQVETLFDALKKQVRQGFFELPNPSRS